MRPYITVAAPRFRIELPGKAWFKLRTTNDLADVAECVRVAELAGLPLKVTRLPLKVTRVPACTWCRARPAAWDQDCDGRFVTTTCDVQQCREARRLAYDGEIDYPPHEREFQTYKRVKPVRARSADGPVPGAVTVNEWLETTCACGNTGRDYGFLPCLPGGAIVEPTDPRWNELWVCISPRCSGVIVDFRNLPPLS